MTSLSATSPMSDLHRSCLTIGVKATAFAIGVTPKCLRSRLRRRGMKVRPYTWIQTKRHARERIRDAKRRADKRKQSTKENAR